MTSTTRLSHCATVFCAYSKFSLTVQNWCNSNLSRKKLEYIFAYTIFSYQLHRQCNCMREGHIEREKLLLVEILISGQRNGWIQRLPEWSIWGDIWWCSHRILVGNVGVVSCRLNPQADMSAADMATCRCYVRYVGSTCHRFMSSQLPWRHVGKTSSRHVVHIFRT